MKGLTEKGWGIITWVRLIVNAGTRMENYHFC